MPMSKSSPAPPKPFLKENLCAAIDRHADAIVGIGEQIMAQPELGFKEHATAKRVTETMRAFGLEPETGLALTGVKAHLKSGRPGPTVALIGELDALVVADHPMAAPTTGAAHACGHNAQIAGLLGAMMGLVDAEIIDHLAGNVVFFAVPAEEYVEIEYRLGLLKSGKVGLLSGKGELIRLGYFDDVDIALMIHTHSDKDSKVASIRASSNGFVAKLVRFEGVASHAGAAPHSGVNALNAAHLAIAAINAQRETFRDEDAVRVHPIITKGGNQVNVVPSEVTMETYVRGKTPEAIRDAAAKVDRALKAGALAVGATVEIQTIPGYLPLINNPGLGDLFESNCTTLFGDNGFTRTGHQAGSTDMGDLSHLLPALHPSMAGASGSGHSVDWHIKDPAMGYIAPAKSLAMMAIDLLYGNADAARQVIKSHPSAMSKDAYLDYQAAALKTETFSENNLEKEATET